MSAAREWQNSAILLRAQIHWSSFRQNAQIHAKLRDTSKTINIPRRISEVACWNWMGRWSSNSAHSHINPRPSPLSSRILRSRLVTHCAHPSPLIYPPTKHCELSPDASFLHHRAICRPSQAFSLLTVAVKSLYHLLHTALWSLDTCSTPRTPCAWWAAAIAKTETPISVFCAGVRFYRR